MILPIAWWALFQVAGSGEPAVMRENALASQQSAVDFREELEQLIDRDASTRQWLDWLKRANDARELAAVATSHQLPWTTWNAPGWRLELRGARGEHLILASDAGVLAAIRQGRIIEMSVMDLRASSGANRRWPYSHAANAQHVTAASATNLAAKSPDLAQWYFYFVGPASEVLPSHALPPPVIQLIR